MTIRIIIRSCVGYGRPWFTGQIDAQGYLKFYKKEEKKIKNNYIPSCDLEVVSDGLSSIGH